MTTESDFNRMVVEWVDLDRLVPYAKNAKKHDTKHIKTLVELLAKGWTMPLVVWPNAKGELILVAGHGRRLAALHRRNELKDTRFNRVPVAILHDKTEAEADQLRLTDNRSNSGTYDTDILKDELSRLVGDGANELLEFAFDDKELSFAAVDLGAMDDSLFVDDIAGAVETQQAENKAAEEAVDKTAAPVGDAFGFKRVTIEQSRAIRSYVSKLEGITGKIGVEAVLTGLALACDRV
jgi:hypothetical protein